ncbi:pyridoxamine 5'-phosphate oxidase family protein [Segetibacter koreensis]|uniref:pyridoxamine 5'-phosphate oxidase family protein n=1 Tax=Segetibacter koreensis TaxID=398037 RepID=UPI00037D0703|nr:pyridoxamine 5'-phosphate oxidase family protein [Segetibacter koreensis]
MIGELNHTEVEEVLQSQLIGRIGCHADGITYIVPVSYAYNESYVYIHSLEGRKVDIMRKNPEVCFEVDVLNNMANWKSVIAWGTFEELKGSEEREKGLKILLNRSLPIISSEMTHLGSDWPFSYNHANEIGGVFYRIKLREKTGKFETNYASTSFNV